MSKPEPTNVEVEDVLVGAVALKAGFIDFDQFRAGLAAAAAQGTSLSDSLTSGGALAPAARQTVERSVEGGLRAAGGDARAALLETLSELPPALADLARGILFPSSLVQGLPRRYEVGELLGEGGAGAVYRGRDTQLGQPVAIKFLRTERATPRSRARFQNEARIGATLDHPNICPVWDTGSDGPTLFMVQKWVRGRSLHEAIEALRGGEAETCAELSLALRVETIIQAAQGLSYAHSRGIVHRDLKPANIMLGHHGEVFVMDWGLAKRLDAPVTEASQPGPSLELDLDMDQGRTADGHLVGTPAYMAPEQIQGRNEQVDERSDVHALGVTLYELLTLQHPFPADALQDLMSAILDRQPSPPRAVDPSIPADLSAICMRCLEKDPSARYRSVDAFLADMRAFRDGRVVVATGTGPWARLRKWTARNRKVAWVSGLALVLVLSSGLLAGFLVLEERARAAEQRVQTRLQTVARLAERARADTEATWQALQSAADADSTLRTGLALASLQSAQRWHVLDPGPAAAQALYRAGTALGEVARASAQWDLAAQAYGSVASLGVADAEASERVEQVQQERSAESTRRREEVLDLLGRARSGKLARRSLGVTDAVFQIVRYPEQQTIDLLAKRLGEICVALLEAEARLFLEAEEGRGPGEERLVNLRGALAQRRQTKPTESLSADTTAVLEEAARRIRARGGPRSARNEVSPLLVAAPRQRSELGDGVLDEAQLIARSLGRIGEGAQRAGKQAQVDQVVAALGRYLHADADERRALQAGLALGRIGSDGALTVLHWARRRYGLTSTFSERTSRLLVERGVSADLPITKGDVLDYIDRASSRMAQGDVRGAVEDYDKALELDPGHVIAYNQRGIAKSRLGRPREALADFNAAISLRSEWGPSYMNRALVLVDLGEPIKAVEDLNRAIKLEPTLALAYLARGDVFRGFNNAISANADYTKAILLDPGLTQALSARASLRQSQGDVSGALNDYSRVLMQDDTSAVTWYNRGTVYQAAGQLKKALYDYSRAVEIDPGLAPAWDNRAVVQDSFGNMEGALADLERALAADPTYVPALCRRARARVVAHQDYAGAVVDATRALELDPSCAQAFLVRGMARAELGEPKQAIGDLQRFLDLAPADHKARPAVEGIIGAQREKLNPPR